MAELKHGAHECMLTSPEIMADGICDICFKDRPVAFACNTCNFDLCTTCSSLPLKVSHGFHSEHPLEFCVGNKDDAGIRYNLCSCCGYLFSGSFYYKCKECDIFLDLDCAILKYTNTSWDAEEMLHYSHAHLLKRCKPGPDVRGSCLMCELPLTPSAISYCCIQCYVFVHERCLNLSREIQHPVHPKHPLKRLDFTHTCGEGKYCDACGFHIDGIPLGCPQCNFRLHLRCADSLLRGLMHKSHQHKLFYVANNAKLELRNGCGVCDHWFSQENPYYHCVECGWWVHFECLEMPESVVKKSYHIHPLVCKLFLPKDDYLEYCGVCETIVHASHHAYCCEECDFVGHVECILREKTPSPLYLKDVARTADQDHERETKDLEKKILLNDIPHTHVLTLDDSGEYMRTCGICDAITCGRLWECETCAFTTHDSCLQLTQQSRYRFHSNHSLIFLPSYPAGIVMRCDTCKREISSFNVFCRICNFILCAPCTVRAKKSLGELLRGQKFIGHEKAWGCLRRQHALVQVMVSRSYPVACAVCNGSLCGKVVSCIECEETYHSRCIELGELTLYNHPLHFDHSLDMKPKRGSKCVACKLDIANYGFACSRCSINFHFNCIEAVGMSRRIENHKHYLYNFWSDGDDSSVGRPCAVCKRPCGASFYGCNTCNLKAAHVECIGFPKNVKNQQHHHAVTLISPVCVEKKCALCGLVIRSSHSMYQYACFLCEELYHEECIMSMSGRTAATEEDQISDIYLMYIEHALSKMIRHYGFITEYMDDSDEEE